ncbi:MAG: DNA repair protein [Lachnospiraceae bacterium]|nr:DNA repair protein [Lachnospiraceae bacterium]
MDTNRQYLAIDLKSFYASVECVERGLDPMKAHLVVADPERGNGTICLAVTPAMKKSGIKNRCRVYEIPGSIPYIKAVPRMQMYIDYSAAIYQIYLKYIAGEDIHVYSIDEAFLDVTDYLKLYKMSARELGMCIVREIHERTGITATCGVGTNLYLAKVAMDMIAKHADDNIGELDEASYKALLWEHRPLTDFWRIGSATAKKLSLYGIFTMRDIADTDPKLLYRIFGKDARLLIDHALGLETATISSIKNYKPKANSLSSSQVLLRDYHFEEAGIVLKEMADSLCLELIKKKLLTDKLSLSVHYSRTYGVPHASAGISLRTASSSASLICAELYSLYCKIVNSHIPIRKIDLCFHRVWKEDFRQYDLFTSPEALEKEYRLQQAIIEIKSKYGSNAVLKGTSLEAGATARERNLQIGGHKSGL